MNERLTWPAFFGVVLLAIILQVMIGAVGDGGVVEASVPGAIMIYSTTTTLVTPNTSQSRTWDGISWSSAVSTSKHAPDMRESVIKTARFKEESLLVTMDAQGYVAAQKFDGSSWGATTTVERLTTVGDSIIVHLILSMSRVQTGPYL